MMDEHADQAREIANALHRHARIAYQQFLGSEAELPSFLMSLPFFLPFRDATYQGMIPILDWDHKLPSKVAIFRLYAYYSEATLRAGTAEYQARTEQILAHDQYPEFDVPDYAGLTADEAYEGEVDAQGKMERVHFVSAWRRDIEQSLGRKAVQLVRSSNEFRKIAGSIVNRAAYLGDLEAVSWTPPCESAYETWTIDVWYLTELNTSVGKGCSFLVDLTHKRVVGTREFFVRAG